MSGLPVTACSHHATLRPSSPCLILTDAHMERMAARASCGHVEFKIQVVPPGPGPYESLD